MASITNLIFETDGKRLSPAASDAEYDVYDGESGSLTISVRLLDGWEALGCVIECQNVNTGEKDMGGSRTGNLLDYTVNGSLLTTGKLAFHLRGTNGSVVLKTDDWFLDVYRSFDVTDGLAPVTPTQYNQLSGQIGDLEGQYGNLLDAIENGDFDGEGGYGADWSCGAMLIPVDEDYRTSEPIVRTVTLRLYRGTELVTGVLASHGVESHTGHTSPAVTNPSMTGCTAAWSIYYPSGSKIFPNSVMTLGVLVSADGFRAGHSLDIAAVPPGRQGEQGERGIQGIQGIPGSNGLTPHIGGNGNWFVGTSDTGIPSRGPQGLQGPQGECDAATDEDVISLLLELDMLPAAVSDGAIITDNYGNIILW